MTNQTMLVINPGSTSTKVALYEGGRFTAQETVDHGGDPWAATHRTVEQLPFRVRVVRDFLAGRGLAEDNLSSIVARGGLLRPLRSGAYRVNQAMLLDLRQEFGGRHASNLGGLIAWELSLGGKTPAFIVDPVSVDEYSPEARVSGLPELPRRSLLHALNMKACARKVAGDLGRPLGDLFLIIVHLGGGFSVSPSYRGMFRDANTAEEGPFAVDRCGALPSMYLYQLLLDRGDGSAINVYLSSGSGMYGHLGTKDVRKVERLMEDDEFARTVYWSMAYQAAKEICAMAAAYPEKPDAVALTGGLARSNLFVSLVCERTGFLGPHMVYPGEDEMESLALGASRVISGLEPSRVYPTGEVACFGASL